MVILDLYDLSGRLYVILDLEAWQLVTMEGQITLYYLRSLLSQYCLFEVGIEVLCPISIMDRK